MLTSSPQTHRIVIISFLNSTVNMVFRHSFSRWIRKKIKTLWKTEGKLLLYFFLYIHLTLSQSFILLTLVCFSQSPKFPNLGWSVDELGISIIALKPISDKSSSSLLIAVCSELSKKISTIFRKYSLDILLVAIIDSNGIASNALKCVKRITQRWVSVSTLSITPGFHKPSLPCLHITFWPMARVLWKNELILFDFRTKNCCFYS
jgi:hypothetical protein